jgi:hypothetical protein
LNVSSNPTNPALEVGTEARTAGTTRNLFYL